MPTGINWAISDKGIAPHHNLVMCEIFVSSIFVTFIELFLFPPFCNSFWSL
ncbi:bifunctional 2',3'-cyclic nucleotide 2'-phosphodiesterase/3'-nucleotidase periplasmic protein [Vibrio cholerae]|nr:bifunctional 2',3'-cyclic nucleotide 2'-phosphodiesterase/3'-nucleotidase periplasmic protein [Vibrio cholerae]